MKNQLKRSLTERGLSMLCAAALVAGMVLGNLDTPRASASERVLTCNQSEHTHGGGCFQRQLTCGQSEHTHGDSCRNEAGEIICGLSEHAHTDGCCTDVLVCSQSEHTHGDGCYVVQAAKSETVPETQPATSGSQPGASGTQQQTAAEPLPKTTAETQQQTVAETRPETPGTQQATETQQETPGIQQATETRPETPGTQQATETQPVTAELQPAMTETQPYTPQTGETATEMQTDTAPEEEVSADGFVPTEETSASGETENADIWKQSVRSVTLTGDYAKDIVAIAGTQLGTRENKKNFIINKEETVQYYSRYGQWYGDTYEEWSAMFVSFCAAYAQIPEQYLPREKDNGKWVEKLGSRYTGKDGYTPQAGDLVFFSENPHKDGTTQLQTGSPAHVGIVVEVNGDAQTLATIEGNAGGAVSRQQYSLGETKITGYMSMAKVTELAGGNQEETSGEDGTETDTQTESDTQTETEAPEFTVVKMVLGDVAHWIMGAEGTDHSWQTLDTQEIIRIEDGSGDTAKIMPLAAGKAFLIHNYQVDDEVCMETFEVEVLETEEEIASDNTELVCTVADEDGSVVTIIRAQIPEGAFAADGSELAMEATVPAELDMVIAQIKEQLDGGRYLTGSRIYQIQFLVNGEVAEPAVEIPLVFEDAGMDLSVQEHVGAFQYISENAQLNDLPVQQITAESGVQFAVPSSGIYGYRTAQLSEAVEFTQEVDGVTVTLTAPEGAFPVDASQVSMTAEPLTDEQRAALEDRLEIRAKKDGMEITEYVAYDINLWVDGEIIQPQVPVTVSFGNTGFEIENARGFQLDEGTETLNTISGSAAENGIVSVDAEHFTITGVSNERNIVVYAGESSVDGSALPSIAPAGNPANAWQTLEQTYHTGYDYPRDSDGKIVTTDVRVQKNVIPAGTENEFYVYLNVEPQLSWEELFRMSGFWIINSNNTSELGEETDVTEGMDAHQVQEILRTGSGGVSHVSKIKDTQNFSVPADCDKSATPTSTNLRINVTDENGNIVKTVIMKNLYYSLPSQVTKTQTILVRLPFSEQYWKYPSNYDASTNSINITVDAAALESQTGTSFVARNDIVHINSISDPLGAYVKYPLEKDNPVVNSGTASYVGDEKIVWDNFTEEKNLSGNMDAYDVVVLPNNEGKTVYLKNAYQMYYKVILDVEAEGFVSCGTEEGVPEKSQTAQAAIYKTNGDTILNYKTTLEGEKTAPFPIPSVRGLLYDLEFVKVDSATGLPLGSAEFELNGTYSVTGNAYSLSVASDAAGKVSFTNLPWGTYILSEKRAPEGYAISYENTSYTLCYTIHPEDLEPDSEHPANYRLASSNIGTDGRISNASENGNLKIWKVDPADRGLPGAVFELYSDVVPAEETGSDTETIEYNGKTYYKYRENGEKTSDDAGKAEWGALPVTTVSEGTPRLIEYLLCEKTAPQGYQDLSEPILFQFENKQDIGYAVTLLNSGVNFSLLTDTNEIKIKNDPVVELEILKTDIETAPLDGAEFVLWTNSEQEAGNDSETKEMKGQIFYKLDTKSSDMEGKLKFTGLWSGSKYILEESDAPEGYMKLSSDIVVTFKEEAGVYIPVIENPSEAFWVEEAKQIHICDKPIAELQLKKVNPEGDLLAGVTFALYTDAREYAPEGAETYSVADAGNIERTYFKIKNIETTAAVMTEELPVFVYDESTQTYVKVNYLLRETSAKEGYALLNSDIRFSFTASEGGYKISLTDGSIENRYVLEEDILKITNHKIYALPSSGSFGTYVFTISGVAVLMTALLLFITNRRKEGIRERNIKVL